jgi:penicillin-binding protein 1C
MLSGKSARFAQIDWHLHRLWNLIKQRALLFAALTGLAALWIFALPYPLFDEPYCAVLEDQHGQLLGARIASDGQWRFPKLDSLPEKYVAAVIAFEDKRFRFHPGVDVLSLLRAAGQNLRAGRVVSGGSTISMQVIRMARGNRRRTFWEKSLEVILALRLEGGYSKKAILQLYAAHAPFGGNIVGLEAASWRYYGKSPQALSWSEAATMAVLPNSPGLMRPGRNAEALVAKRNRLLDKLVQIGRLDTLDGPLAAAEPMPGVPHPLPNLAPHLMDKLVNGKFGQGTRRLPSTIDIQLQERVTAVLARRQAVYRGNEVHNMAAVIIDVPTGALLAYVGNVVGAGAEHGESVDCAAAPRSTGSILKPYLYALALESGDILPNSLLHDVPTQLGQYRPENYFETYDGAVPARRALIRSLNVPFVLLLQQYGLDKCHFNFKRLGLSTINRPPEHYGLSLILGGAEATLLEITNVYAGMARVLLNFYARDGRYAANDFRAPVFTPAKTRNTPLLREAPMLSAGTIWHTFEAMQQVERPMSAGEWELFQGSRPIAWKTGTSFGFRDAWASGVTPHYAVGVWVGNADGEGRPGLLGVQAAAPVLFELFDLLPDDGWFDTPYDAMVQAAVCPLSGWRANPNCPADTVWIPKSGLNAKACPNHELLHLDASGAWQVNSTCAAPSDMQHVPWFVLPPMEAHYFIHKNPWFRMPPAYRPDCLQGAAAAQQAPMQLIYPKQPTAIYVPVDLDGKLGSTVFEVAHQRPNVVLYWHLDGAYLGSTQQFHQMALQPGMGKHTLALVDADGYRIEQVFEVISRGGERK